MNKDVKKLLEEINEIETQVTKPGVLNGRLPVVAVQMWEALKKTREILQQENTPKQE
jgi:hypothetical protein